MKERKRIIAYFMILGIFPLLVVIFFIFDKDDHEKKFGKYKIISKETILNSKIIEIISDRGTFITLRDCTFCASPGAINLNYSPSDLGYFLEIGDSLFKNKNSDTLYIFRNNKKYYFRFKHKIVRDSFP